MFPLTTGISFKRCSQPSSLILFMISCRFLAPTPGLLFSTRETVAAETPVIFAISFAFNAMFPPCRRTACAIWTDQTVCHGTFLFFSQLNFTKLFSRLQAKRKLLLLFYFSW